MRTLLTLALTLAACALPAKAQMLRPHFQPTVAASKTGAPAAGARHGHDFGERTGGHWRGDYVRRDSFFTVDFAPAGYGYYDYAPYDWSDYGYNYATTPSAAASGLWLGALTGAIVGNNSGEFRHDGWRGAAWGAGLGWLFSTAIDANRRAAVYAPAAGPAPIVTSVAPTSTTLASPRGTAIGSAPATSMSSANALFGRD